MISFGIIGAGIIVEAHLKAIRERSDILLKAVCDRDEKKARKAAEPFGAKVYLDYSEMLEKEKLDAVIINLPHFLHEPCVAECAAHGIHILCEKPMSVSAESCRRMTKICHDANVVLQIGHVQRYASEVKAARDLIRQGAIGAPLLINDMRYDNYFLPQRPRWFLDKKLSGGGVMINLGAHAIDKILCLTDSDVETVTGYVTYARPEFDVEGSAQAFLTMKNGTTATITLCGYAVDGYYNVTTIFGSKGYLRMNCSESLWLSQESGELEPIDLSSYAEPFVAQLEDFMKALQGAPVVCSGEYGTQIIETIEKLYKSGRGQSHVD